MNEYVFARVVRGYEQNLGIRREVFVGYAAVRGTAFAIFKDEDGEGLVVYSTDMRAPLAGISDVTGSTINADAGEGHLKLKTADGTEVLLPFNSADAPTIGGETAIPLIREQPVVAELPNVA